MAIKSTAVLQEWAPSENLFAIFTIPFEALLFLFGLACTIEMPGGFVMMPWCLLLAWPMNRSLKNKTGLALWADRILLGIELPILGYCLLYYCAF